MKRPHQTARTPVPTLRPLTVADLAPVRGGAYEGYIEIEFEKQGKNKG